MIYIMKVGIESYRHGKLSVNGQVNIEPSKY